jgi:hypothetical protein
MKCIHAKNVVLPVRTAANVDVRKISLENPVGIGNETNVVGYTVPIPLVTICIIYEPDAALGAVFPPGLELANGCHTPFPLAIWSTVSALVDGLVILVVINPRDGCV